MYVINKLDNRIEKLKEILKNKGINFDDIKICRYVWTNKIMFISEESKYKKEFDSMMKYEIDDFIEKSKIDENYFNKDNIIKNNTTNYSENNLKDFIKNIRKPLNKIDLFENWEMIITELQKNRLITKDEWIYLIFGFKFKEK